MPNQYYRHECVYCDRTVVKASEMEVVTTAYDHYSYKHPQKDVPDIRDMIEELGSDKPDLNSLRAYRRI